MLSRKDFIKLAVLAFLGTTFHPIEIGVEMEFGDLLVKIANNARLTPLELDYLKKVGTEVQLKNSFIEGLQNGAGNLRVNSISSQSTFFSNMPNSFLVLDKSTTPLSVNNDAFTTVTSYEPYVPITGDFGSTSNDFFELDTANGRIYIKQPSRTIGFYVFNIWASNATGNRSCRVYQYNKDGTQITFSSAFRIVAVSGASTTFATTIFVPWGGARDVGDYVTMQVYQNSGGALNLTDCALGAFIIR